MTPSQRAWMDLLVTPQPVFHRGRVRAPAPALAPTLAPTLPATKKRRRDPVPDLSVWSFPVVGAATARETTVPDSLQEMQTSLLNYLSQILPVECRVNFAGTWTPFVLLAPLYRNNNLAWLMLNRDNLKVYLSCHWHPDATHLFESLRPSLQLTPQTDRKWHRQGFNQICRIYKSPDEYITLSDLPTSVLKAPGTSFTLGKVKEFMRGGTLLADFKTARVPQLPVCLGEPAQGTRGWRVFGPTQPMSGMCKKQGKRVCGCDRYCALVMDTKTKLPYEEATAAIVTHLPSGLPDDLTALFGDFAKLVRDNPTRRFFPQSL